MCENVDNIIMYNVFSLHRFVKDLEKGLPVPTMLYTYSPGSSVLNHNFIWRLPDDCAIEACLSLNQQLVCKIMDQLPVFHTRAMKQELINHYGLLMSGIKSYVLRSIYTELTNDVSCSLYLELKSKKLTKGSRNC